ncbi:hypothetical protein P152DRAFT_456984 [Eremomyces bilateralis CBS 781.70]|uniref:NAD(+) diphosphatase n=1 Tax=Eremomyces bilateralis CBS 781.70 TaxID=1392243 RepID=A0A6G1G6L6_9PEZI|nr:uncharacterized protein P152DRAFT_456984 [Eremomyces bilateralis CBS 781.70]KAF1813601.1 hypothetical protein P152DRAFT_456984 [Eremomyces bilateralis CBS 781.70]
MSQPPQQQPSLPEPAHADIDSMLSRKFGKEVANYFAGSPLNRVSFLRTDHAFLSTALNHPSTTFLVLNNFNALVTAPKELAYVKYDAVKAILGGDPFVKSEAELLKEYNSTTYLPQVVFLGLDPRREDGIDHKGGYKGAPVFAIDITPKSTLKDAAEKLVQEFEGKGYSFPKDRVQMSFPAHEAAIYAEARHVMDWNARNPFCAQCGQPTLSINAGWKRSCPPTDLARVGGVVGSTTSETPSKRPDCATRTSLSNVSFPRTDPTVIMAVVSADGHRVLMGRQKRWPAFWYSTLAGFLEPAESVEEAVRREVWEESGITLGRVVIHSTQPWPYPANLMIGAIGQAIAGDGEKVHLGHDAELEDAKWFTMEEVRTALRVGTSGLGDAAGAEYKEGGLRLPPSTAIANQLLTAVANGFVSGDSKI